MTASRKGIYTGFENLTSNKNTTRITVALTSPALRDENNMPLRSHLDAYHATSTQEEMCMRHKQEVQATIKIDG